MLDKVNKKLKHGILYERELRRSNVNSFLSFIPENLKFQAFSEQYHIKEIISYCKDDYRDLIVALLMKDKRESIKCYQLIDWFCTRPLIYVCLLNIHPSNKVKILGKSKFIIIKCLRKNLFLFSIVKKLYKLYKR